MKVTMTDPVFFEKTDALSLGDIAVLVGAEALPDGAEAIAISNVAPIDEAGEGQITFLDNPKYVASMSQTHASAVLCSRKHREKVPEGVVALVVANPYQAFSLVSAAFYPQSMTPLPFFGQEGISQGAHIHPTAKLEENVCVEPGASIGANAEIGEGSVVGVNAVIGQGVRVGRNSHVGANAVIQHSLIGDQVIIHPGVCIGQDGFGFAMSPMGHRKVPQIGRVIVQDHVEIGANTTIDRGANRDTIIGEGTKIDNQVQIGHNVEVGRHCVLVSQDA